MKIDQLSDGDWENVLQTYPQHGFFSRPSWYRLFEAVFPGEYKASFFHCHDAHVDVFVPCFTKKWVYGLSTLASAPMDGAAGLFSPAASLSAQDVAAVMTALCRRVGVAQVYLTLTPYQELGQGHAAAPAVLHHRTTHLLDATPSYEALYGAFSHKVRKNLANANRSGLEVMLGEKRDVVDFHRLMRALYVERFKRPEAEVLPLELYQRLLELDGAELVVVRDQASGAVVSGTVCLFSNFEYYQWHNATDYAFSGRRPNDLWEDFVIRRAKSKSIPFVNMGASPSEGVEKFKESFGAVRSTYTEIELQAGWYAFLRGMKRWTLRRFGMSRANAQI